MGDRDHATEEGGLVELVEDQTGLRTDSLTVDSIHDPTDVSLGEPPTKQMRIETEEEQMHNYFTNTSIKNILENINKSLGVRLDAIDQNLQTLGARLLAVERKVEDVQATVNILNIKADMEHDGFVSDKKLNISRKSGVVVIGVPGGKRTETLPNKDDGNIGQNVTLITLNSEADFPNGSWCGDENNLEMRVRTPIPASTLLHINTNCRTPEKMALTLLDYLFDRETQAVSNLSGLGKYNKKQLEPLYVYAIRCHLVHHFGITESDWHRIKQNLDSKCRTAFRRKRQGLHMSVKSFRGTEGLGHDDLDELDDKLLNQDNSVSASDVSDSFNPEAKNPTDIQILHATPEQLSQLRHAQHIEILQGDQVFGHLEEGNTQMQMAISIKTASGDIVHLDGASLVPISASALTGQLSVDCGGDVNVPLGELG